MRESTADTWVFWIHASNTARVEQGYQQIAAIAEIPGRDDPKMNILQLVYQWLCDARNGRWLMVLDNADDDGIFFSGNTFNEQGPLLNFLPQAAHGSVLITSRNGLAARNLVGCESHVITVQPMNEGESLALLRARIPASQPGESGEDEKALVLALEYIPLAITQAGSYIANRSPRVTVSRYLQLFRESESNQTYLLQHDDAKDLRRDPSIRHAVIKTWQLSFEQIHRDRPAATDLLALMSMFDRQGIPEGLVRGDGDGLQFEDAVAPLINYSLVRFESKAASFDMHRLVQLSVRTWLEIHLELSRWQKKSRAIIAQMFPNGEYETWTECRRLLPHAREAVKSTFNTDEDDSLNVATISSNCGGYLHCQGAYFEAETMHRRAFTLRENILGSEHPCALASTNQLGLVLDSQGKYEEAEMVYRQALTIYEKVFGLVSRDTATIANNLGYVLDSRGKFEEAIALYRRGLEVREKLLGPEDLDTINSVNNIGHLLAKQGKFAMSEAMYRRALEARKKILGLAHPHTLTIVNNLGTVLQNQGKYGQAEAMHRQALAINEKVLGSEHHITANSVNNVGLALDSQGKSVEAEAMHRRALGVYKKLFGREHPLTLTCFSNLGNALDSQGKYEEAEGLHRQTLETREKVLGSEHPDTLININNLGNVLFAQGKYKEAATIHRRALEVRQKVLGCEHPDTLTSLSHLGNVLFRQKKYEEAEEMHHRALEALDKVLGRVHLDTLATVSNLGFVLSTQGKYDEAGTMGRRALEGYEEVLGREHPHTLTSVKHLVFVLSRQGKYEEAKATHRRAL